MKIDLSGKRAVVSGSTAGIGLAIATAGAEVVVNGRTEERVQQAIATIREAAPTAILSGIASDMATAEGAAMLARAVPEADILVNSVGAALFKFFDDLTDEDWLFMYQLNVMSGVRLTKHYLPGMTKRGWGRVVFISSESALNPPKEMIDYGMTKAAQLAVSRGVAELAGRTGVTVNSVLPGPTRSEGFGNVLEGIAQQSGQTIEQVEQDFLASNRPTSLLGRFSTTEEIANMVVYICSQQASATSGAALRVDGGVVRSIS
ncbi:SDR family oxidoreductase [Rhizobium laguerreae]|uniref:SDR family NAD(P)-dependent oxidoreductase n=1 Tax=Rhizobium laguerreae TaxID=1076926 RepID=UPI001C915083|nr:SDR family oxidoreductase [Rhizobium laguerreae]MBY3307896.1 SDR family oxidoreductase [Rhizobium laguerreae]